MPRPPHSSRFDYPNNIGRAVQIINVQVNFCLPSSSRNGSLTSGRTCLWSM